MIMAPMATRPATATEPEKVEAAPVNGAAVGVIGTLERVSLFKGRQRGD